MIRTITPSELQERLAAFEYLYGMSTADFLTKWRRGETENDSDGLEPWDYIDWAIMAQALERTVSE